MTGRRALCGGAAVILVVALASPTDRRAQAATGPVGLTSPISHGVRGEITDYQFSGVVSGNGRYTAFTSGTPNLVPGDHNGESDVFIRDRVAKVTDRVSLTGAGREGDGASGGPAISRDGRYVAFSSSAANLVSGDTNNSADVFVRDRSLGTTTRISIATGGAQANGPSGGASISGDGRYVGFPSEASTLVAGDTNGSTDVFVRDLVVGSTVRVNVTDDEEETTGRVHLGGVGDGGQVAFWSDAATLVPDDTNDAADVFLRDTVDGTTSRVSVDSTGRQADGASTAASISPDGRHLLFVSEASNLITEDTNDVSDVFVRDLGAGRNSRVSVGSGEVEAAGASGSAAMSADARYVTFISSADNLVPGDTNQSPDVFVRDRTSGGTDRATVTSDGSESTATEYLAPSISDDGRLVVFGSFYGALGPWSNEWQLWVRDRRAPATPFGDFDGDGLADLVARRSATGALILHPGTGVGLYGTTAIGAYGWNAMDVIARLGDFDGDGREDVLARQTATGELWLYPGRLTRLATRVRIGTGWSRMREITPVGDFDGDGRADVTAVDQATGNLYLFPGRGTSFAPRRLIGRGGWNGMSELTGAGDFTRDSRPDLIASSTTTGELFVYPGTRTGFAPRMRIGTGWKPMRDLAGVGDFDRDGFTDLAAVRSSTGELHLYTGRGNGLRTDEIIGTGWTGYRPIS
ncbi:MAG TPA: FG-GAP-like repeat-containing protein [Microlunatus sp.]|nr:FG-GAP-like repeat-containing protein [Microlunatus sp.]